MSIGFICDGPLELPPSTWQTSFVGTLNANSGSLGTLNLKIGLLANVCTVSGSKIRFTLIGPTTENCKTTACYIQQAGGAGPTQVTFNNGTGALVIPQNGMIVTDEIVFAFDKTLPFRLTWYVNDAAQDDMRQNFSTPNAGSSYFFVGGADDSADPLNVSGYTHSDPIEALIGLIEVYGP